jgi:hypothetical protein
MSAASNYLENKVLDHVLGEGGRNYTSPATLYVALFNNTSGNAITNLEAGTLTDEVSTGGTAYGRKTVDFAAAAGGSASTNGDVTFDVATASWGTVTHAAVMDAATTGNVLFYGALTVAKTVTTGDTFKITSGQLTITLA